MFLNDTTLEACFIPSSTSFFPIFEFSALTPTTSSFLSNPVEVSAFHPTFANVPKRFRSCCVLCLLLFLGPICIVHFTVTLQGKFRLLTLSYLTKNDCPFGSLTHCGIARLLNIIFCLGILAVMSSFNFSTTYYIS